MWMLCYVKFWIAIPPSKDNSSHWHDYLHLRCWGNTYWFTFLVRLRKNLDIALVKDVDLIEDPEVWDERNHCTTNLPDNPNIET